jgi:cytochrome P450
MHPRIQVIVDELLDRVQPQGQMDVVADFAGQLPARVFTEILGLPAEDWECLHRWSDDLFRIFDPLMPLKICDRMNQAALAFTAYLRPQIAQRRQHPTSDLISALMAVQEQGDCLSEEEVIA